LNKVMKAGIAGLVGVHFVATAWHGDAHKQLAITLPPEKEAFVYVVIILAPIIAAILVWTRQVKVGAWVFFLSMLGSLLFGVYHHYVLVSADHVQHLPNGSASVRSAFITSAAAIAVIEFVSALYGALCLRRLRVAVGTGHG
jgi:hypothetical protein